jgi:hypothetical protein
MAGEDKRKLKEDIEYADEEIRKLEDEERQRKQRVELAAEEDLQTKSRILDRDIIDEGVERLSGDPGGDDDAGAKREEDKKKKKAGDVKDRYDEGYGVPLTVAPSYSQPPAGRVSAEPIAKAAAVTGTLHPPSKPTLIARSGAGSARELIIRRWDSYLKRRGERGQVKLKDVYQRMWLLSKAEASVREDTRGSLRALEDSSEARLVRMNELNNMQVQGRLKAAGEGELHNLEDQEAKRYILREKYLGGMPLAEQKKMTWLRPLGEGAYSVIPYTFLTTWDLLSTKERKIARWYYDNVLLRWQHAMVGRFIPKKAEMRWFKKKVKGEAERLFEDVDEEIYSEKKFAEMVKTGQAQLEDVEEELAGYDRFTVEEEKQIKKIFEEEITRQAELEKIIETY